jgi:DNA (cytosine-5)-methyltransferase 1
VGENVRGLTNWNGGLVFDEVCTDLENLGYQVAPFIIPASAVNAPHQRERVWFVANTNGTNSETWAQREILGQSNWQATNGFMHVECGKQWQNFPTQSPICGGNDGLPTELDGITFSKWRNESIKAYGNAVVPQVVFQIFKAIEKYESL